MTRPVSTAHPVTLGYRAKAKFDPNYIHRGIDYGCAPGTTVKATEGGRVVHAGRGGMGPAFGIHVVLRTGNVWHIYAHLSSESVSVGQWVDQGQTLGKSGATGNVTGAHLHYGEFTTYHYKSDRRPLFIDSLPPKPPKATVPWYTFAFVNVWGDDGAEGTRTLKARLPQLVDDVTKHRPEVVGLCEVQQVQEPAVTKAMKAQGYVKAGYSHRLGLYVLPSVDVERVSFYRYPKQNKGADEGILRARLRVNGHWTHIGLTHLDYRDGFDDGRVTQMKQGVTAMERFGVRYDMDNWTKASVIAGDLNSTAWVVDKALEPVGLKDVGAGARIDFITTGRSVQTKGMRSTRSDHPVIWATLAKSK